MSDEKLSIYEMGISCRVGWQAHSMSNAGSNGTNRLLPRRQLLADGTQTDAYSGNIAKHYHSVLLAEQMQAMGIPLCAACARRDGRRAAALSDIPNGMAGLLMCGLCDVHGFLVTGKKSSGDDAGRSRFSKHSLVEFAFALALPEKLAESPQLFTRFGTGDADGQMIMKKFSRSGEYAQCIRYKAVGIGVDTDVWQQLITDEFQRDQRHQATLIALRDQLLSPSGAVSSTMLPHMTGIEGVITIRTAPGRAPLYSPLQSDYIDQLEQMVSENCRVMTFRSPAQLSKTLSELASNSFPYVLSRPVNEVKADL